MIINMKIKSQLKANIRKQWKQFHVMTTKIYWLRERKSSLIIRGSGEIDEKCQYWFSLIGLYDSLLRHERVEISEVKRWDNWCCLGEVPQLHRDWESGSQLMKRREKKALSTRIGQLPLNLQWNTIVEPSVTIKAIN